MNAVTSSPNAQTPSLRILPLGGLGEIGKNMMVLECGDDIIVVDCGIQFPTEDMPGVDLIIPDVSYLAARSHRVRGILITHGHEDHIGALPHVLPDLDVPVYAPRLAHGLITVKLNERRRTRDAIVHVIEPEQPVSFGANFRATWFRVCHSIPDAMGICIDTPWGAVIHTGDFKIDHTPVDGHTIDLPALAERGANGVLLLLSDSTYAELPGYTPSEQTMSPALDHAIGDAPGRVIIATFASLISRIQQVVTAAEKHGRHVAFVGRSMVANVQMATQMGYLDRPARHHHPGAGRRRAAPRPRGADDHRQPGRTNLGSGADCQVGEPRRGTHRGRHCDYLGHAHTWKRAGGQPRPSITCCARAPRCCTTELPRFTSMATPARKN